MRIFIALDIDDGIRGRLHRFLDGVCGFAPEARWVRPESMHVTLKFVGETSIETVEEIKKALSGIRAATFEVSFRGYGFFPTARSARVFWAGVAAGPELAALAKSVDEAAAGLGIPPEEHGFSPHLTLARLPSPRRRGQGTRTDGPHPSFQPLQERLTAMPALEFGTMTAREFFLYQSQPTRGGARYTKIAGFGLG